MCRGCRSTWVGVSLSLLLIGLGTVTVSADEPVAVRGERPTMRDFMGLNVHTVQFKPDLYKPICRRLRDYHPMDWDVGADTSRATTFPLAENRVDWSQLYGCWSKDGYDVDACVMFDKIKPAAWKDLARDAEAYGKAFASYFGPSGKQPWVTSVEIGNEPSDYSAPEYRQVFQAMAQGLRAGDAKLKIVTCAVATGKVDQWSKPTAAIDGLGDIYDVLNTHSYPFLDGWPTWRRSYPEDPRLTFLKSIEELAKWRDEHARGKPVWLTEFGYDSATKTPTKDGPWAKWVGVTDLQQAQWIARAFLVLSAGPADRAYLFFFNDQDEPQLHAASGITRNFKPKPSFHAVAYLYRTLGDFRFERAIVKKDDVYCFSYEKPGTVERVYVAWSPTGSGVTKRVTLPLELKAAAIERAERMPTSDAAAEKVDWKSVAGGIEAEISETPVFLFAR